MENIKFYNYIEFEKFSSGVLSDESKKIKEIFKNIVILQYIKKKLNENNFMNELENNFNVYLYIEETIKTLN